MALAKRPPTGHKDNENATAIVSVQHLRSQGEFRYAWTMERNTRQRTAIREAVARAGRPLLPHEVLGSARADAPGLSIATVYRNLRSLVDEGALRAVVLPGESARYEPAGGGHHHHFQCRRCLRVFEVQACPGDLDSLAPSGFTVEDHELTLYGLCKECSPRTAIPADDAAGLAHAHCRAIDAGTRGDM